MNPVIIVLIVAGILLSLSSIGMAIYFYTRSVDASTAAATRAATTTTTTPSTETSTETSVIPETPTIETTPETSTVTTTTETSPEISTTTTETTPETSTTTTTETTPEILVEDEQEIISGSTVPEKELEEPEPANTFEGFMGYAI